MANQQAKIITPEKIEEIRYSLPKSWVEAIGTLKKKRINPLQYQGRIKANKERMRKTIEKTY